MQPIIDADTHISESEEMWAMFDKSMYGRRPVLLGAWAVFDQFSAKENVAITATEAAETAAEAAAQVDETEAKPRRRFHSQPAPGAVG